jgi:hypothetical protein
MNVGRSLPGMSAMEQTPVDVSQYKEISRPPTPSKGDFVTHRINEGDLATKGTLFIPQHPPTDGSAGHVLYLNDVKNEQREASEQMPPPPRPQ